MLASARTLRALGYCAMLTSMLTSMGTSIGCGDDSEDAVADAADAAVPMDAGDDPGPSVARRDAAKPDGPSIDLVPDCDRWNPLSCTGGRVCQLVARRMPDSQQWALYPGCVEQPVARGEGDPCDPWGGFLDPYELPGLADEVHLNPCQPGLLCSPAPRARGSNVCQPACASGRTGEPVNLCDGSGQYCWADAAPEASVYQEFCVDSDDCDPADPGSCGPEAGCFLRFDDTRAGTLSICLPLGVETLDDGEPCSFVNDCNAGSSCWGPPGVAPSDWDDSDLRCRRACGGGAADDAGTPEGLDGAACGEGAKCRGFAGAGLDFSAIGAEVGLCE